METKWTTASAEYLREYQRPEIWSEFSDKLKLLCCLQLLTILLVTTTERFALVVCTDWQPVCSIITVYKLKKKSSPESLITCYSYYECNHNHAKTQSGLVLSQELGSKQSSLQRLGLKHSWARLHTLLWTTYWKNTKLIVNFKHKTILHCIITEKTKHHPKASKFHTNDWLLPCKALSAPFGSNYDSYPDAKHFGGRGI